jgi:hypothetical protein
MVNRPNIKTRKETMEPNSRYYPGVGLARLIKFWNTGLQLHRYSLLVGDRRSVKPLYSSHGIPMNSLVYIALILQTFGLIVLEDGKELCIPSRQTNGQLVNTVNVLIMFIDHDCVESRLLIL